MYAAKVNTSSSEAAVNVYEPRSIKLCMRRDESAVLRRPVSGWRRRAWIGAVKSKFVSRFVPDQIQVEDRSEFVAHPQKWI